MRNRILKSARVFAHKSLINYKEKNNNSTVDKPGGHHLNQAIKVNIPSTGSCDS